MKRKYDTTVARIAGNLAGRLIEQGYGTPSSPDVVAEYAVRIARAIVVQVYRTEPDEGEAES